MTQLSAGQLSRFVRPGRVHRRIYTDPMIFELELEQIFGAAWIYVGHESQVKHPGDYFATRMGRKPVVLVRDWDQNIHVLHNQCAHRGALVVATERGNAAEFTCCYHGWTYHLDASSGCLCSMATRATRLVHLGRLVLGTEPTRRASACSWRD